MESRMLATPSLVALFWSRRLFWSLCCRWPMRCIWRRNFAITFRNLTCESQLGSHGIVLHKPLEFVIDFCRRFPWVPTEIIPESYRWYRCCENSFAGGTSISYIRSLLLKSRKQVLTDTIITTRLPTNFVQPNYRYSHSNVTRWILVYLQNPTEEKLVVCRFKMNPDGGASENSCVMQGGQVSWSRVFGEGYLVDWVPCFDWRHEYVFSEFRSFVSLSVGPKLSLEAQALVAAMHLPGRGQRKETSEVNASRYRHDRGCAPPTKAPLSYHMFYLYS